MVQPTPEIDAFIGRIQTLSPGPSVSLDAALQPSLDEEAELRTLFATDRQNARLSNPYVGLVDVFAAPDAIRVTRARVVQGKEDLSSQYVMPLSNENRRQEGAPCLVADLEEFKKNWAIFTEGSLLQLLDWNNVIAAGGSVLASLSPLDEEHKKSKRAIRKYYHSNVYPTSDVDLFLWGLNAEQAEAKIKQIFEAVRDSVPWDVTCIRSRHTISIHSQYPYRSVQIVLRLYHSPAEVLAGFDIDAPCCAYDGTRVWANPRAIVAMMRQCNIVDMTRRSPSYEVRLAKYAERCYEVYVPTLNRDKVDPTIYERSIIKIKGLARLLVLEKLKDDRMRASFLHERRQLRDRPTSAYRYTRFKRRKYKGDLKQSDDNKGLEMNSYDVGLLHIPYGPGWDARRIDKLVYQTDLGMNSTFNPKNKGRRLHRHAAFFGTAEEILEDCCEHCSKPIDRDEEELQKKEDESYIRGRIQFIDENPGRQSMTGSFNPIDEGEWGEQAYIHPTALLFQAITKHDRTTVQHLLNDEEAGVNLHRRDHVGRTALHVAILVKAVEIAEDLIDAGTRITARLADGRAPLHLAAQYDLPRVINKLVERSKKNQFDLDNPKKSDTDPAQPGPERPSSEDDWSSHDDEDVVKSFSEGDGDDEDEEDENDREDKDEGEDRKTSKGKKQDDTPDQQEDVPDDIVDEPDIINVNIQDWDFGFSAICYAVLYGSLSTLEALLAAGADPKLPTAPSPTTSYVNTPIHPLTLTIIRKDDSHACEMAESLIKAGATSTTADSSVRTIFHSLVSSGRTRLVDTVLRCDPDIDKVINLPYLQWNNVVFPIVTAIQLRCYSTLMAMVAHGARLDLQEIDVTKARDAAAESTRRSVLGYREVDNYLQLACQPVEVALGQNDDVAQLIISIGATVDFGLKRSLEGRSSSGTVKQTVKDWVEFGLKELTERISKQESELLVPDNAATVLQTADSPKTGWLAYVKEYEDCLKATSTDTAAAKTKLEAKKQALEELNDAKAYLLEVQEVLSKRNAKPWYELYPSTETEEPKAQIKTPIPPSSPIPEQEWVYVNLSSRSFSYRTERVPQHLVAAYDELYEACYNGDNEKIQKLCLPDCGPEADSDGGESPLNISVRYVTKPTGYYYPDWGYTPLSAAVAGRRWSSAKLILAIAAAQYEPGENDEKIEFSINVIDDDTDTESTNSDESDITIDQEQIRFVDIATRSSKVRSQTHPTTLLETQMPYWKLRRDGDAVGPYTGRAAVLKLAVIQSDLDSFVHIANLYESLPQSVELPDLMDTILQLDQPQILDEYIRRTGDGIDITGAQESAKIGPIPIAINDENKIYLGLNVHGKKRVDLAKKNDPNATGYDSPTIPLVWRAITEKATAIVSYLSSEAPLAAYRHYASVHSNSKAIWFRRLGTNRGGELEKWLPKWLGWSCEVIGESPLSTAILSGNVEMVKLVAKLNPKLFSQCMQTEIKFLGLNPLLLAVGSSGNIKVIEFLLKNEVSHLQRDVIRGWNLYHYICSANKGGLLEFFLEKLPQDVTENLLTQKSRRRGNTPLHLAVKCGHASLVSILLDYKPELGLLIQDVDGQTPLHSAVARSYSTIVRHLLLVIPKEGLAVENSVGNTPREIVALAELLNSCKKLKVSTQSSSGSSLSPDSIDPTIARIPVDQFSKYEAELKDLRDITPEIIDRGTVPDERKLHMKNEINNWVNKMLAAFKAAKKCEERRESEREARKDEEKKKKQQKGLPDETPYPSDTADLTKTFELMTNACKADDFQLRRLIHLLDVQNSVGYSLNKVNPDTEEDENDGSPKLRSKGRYKKSVDLEDNDVEPEQREPETFMVFRVFDTTADPW